MKPRDIVTFKTPKGRELTGRILMRGDWTVAVVTERPKMTFIIEEKEIAGNLTNLVDKVR